MAEPYRRRRQQSSCPKPLASPLTPINAPCQLVFVPPGQRVAWRQVAIRCRRHPRRYPTHPHRTVVNSSAPSGSKTASTASASSPLPCQLIASASTIAACRPAIAIKGESCKLFSESEVRHRHRDCCSIRNDVQLSAMSLRVMNRANCIWVRTSGRLAPGDCACPCTNSDRCWASTVLSWCQPATRQCCLTTSPMIGCARATASLAHSVRRNSQSNTSASERISTLSSSSGASVLRRDSTSSLTSALTRSGRAGAIGRHHVPTHHLPARPSVDRATRVGYQKRGHAAD